VKGALSTLVDPARMRSDGKADAEPVAANDSPANRAKNRRVDIVLLTESDRVAAAPAVTPAATAAPVPGAGK
jgi:type VI secretion system protein ImpK